MALPTTANPGVRLVGWKEEAPALGMASASRLALPGRASVAPHRSGASEASIFCHFVQFNLRIVMRPACSNDHLSDVLFAWLISHQPAVLFTQNKSAISKQPTIFFSQNKPAPATSQTNRRGY
jgi:hypothetical protein